MTLPDCALCRRPVQDPAAYLCAGCQDQLGRDLAELADLGDALDDAIARRTRYGDGSGARPLFAPLPWDDAASRTADRIRNTLSTWCRLVAEERGHEPPRDTMASMATWLARHADWLAHRPEAAVACREMHGAARDAERAADRPPARWYAGPCGATLADGTDCGTELYALPDHTHIHCKGCGSTYDVSILKARLLEIARDKLVHAAWAAQAVAAFGVPVTEDQVYGWARRGRLPAKGVDFLDRPTYAVGDVVDLAVEAQAAKERKAAKRQNERMSA